MTIDAPQTELKHEGTPEAGFAPPVVVPIKIFTTRSQDKAVLPEA